MSEEESKEKDLTGISELSLKASVDTPVPSPDLNFEESQVEKIDAFESLENLSQAQPLEDDSPFPISQPGVEMASSTDSTEIQGSVPNPGSPTVPEASSPATLPFSLMIAGKVSSEEREKILEIVGQENLGIREVDLELQFQVGKILIPRISEYAGTVLIQALRGTRAEIKFGPSDSIFSTPDTRETIAETQVIETVSDTYVSKTSEEATPAEWLPVTQEPFFPNSRTPKIIDVITASAPLQTEAIEAVHSAEYQELLENLQRELKYKAYRKGATGIVSFRIQMTPLTLPSQYRILVMGTAIQHEFQDNPKGGCLEGHVTSPVKT